jgi:hypothetical protein
MGDAFRRLFWGTEMPEYWWVVVAAAALLAALAWIWFPRRRSMPESRLAEVRRDFHRQRERLEAKFMQLGSYPTNRDAPRWIDCDFEDDVAFARNRATGELTALVGVTIEIEDLERRSAKTGDAVGNRRAATAVFRFHVSHWETDGRAIFNFTPVEAIRFYQRDLEMIGHETPSRR